MAGLTGIAFSAPWLLLGLLALPILWLLLRAVPPAPVRRLFPGIVLLQGLSDDERESARTPWWLLLLRMLALAALIVGFAGPILNPPREEAAAGDGPLLLLLDGSWADARDWENRIARADAALEAAAARGRIAAVMLLSAPLASEIPFQSAETWRSRLPALAPNPWEPDMKAALAWAGALGGRFETLWLSDGLARPGRAPLLEALRRRGPVRVFESPRALLGIGPARLEQGELRLSVLRARPAGARDVAVLARGAGPNGAERVLARATVRFAPGARKADLRLSLPVELRNRINRLVLEGQNTAAAVSLAADVLRRRKVGLVRSGTSGEGDRLLSPLHYLRQALQPASDVIEGTLGDLTRADPDVIVLADVAALAPAEAEALRRWVEGGGLLLRFAGPHLAASDVGRGEADPLLPVRLRSGGRILGGAMSWGTPKKLSAFPEGSPFFGLPVPDDVEISAQVLAEPDPELAGRTIAVLADGTPLVTRKALGSGQVVLFHVTANAQWSNLPLSGLFVKMLGRLLSQSATGADAQQDLAAQLWEPRLRLDAFGAVHQVQGGEAIPGERLAAALPEGRTGPGLAPGIYQASGRAVALNVIGPERELSAASWPRDLQVLGMQARRGLDLKPWLLGFGLLLLAADILASLLVSGRMSARRRPRASLPALAGLGLLIWALSPALVPGALHAQQAPAGDDSFAIEATAQLHLAHVLTGDARVDEIAHAGLVGLSDVLFARTSVEPADPIGVDIETRELAFFPFLYWPVTPDQPLPSPQAYARLNRYLANGGMILFDTRDADIAGSAPTANARRLREIAFGLDIPPLEPLPEDHVLTRSFYLLKEMPGRYRATTLWIEAAPPDAERIEGMPFRNLNDNVSPVIIGNGDWAAAWAIDQGGQPLLPVGRGRSGERQREFAYRFGVNLIMYALTGNYKSDQVHVPALLERLGQ